VDAEQEDGKGAPKGPKGSKFLIDLPLIGGAVLTLRLSDLFVRERTEAALHEWTRELLDGSLSVAQADVANRSGDEFVTRFSSDIQGYTVGPRTMRREPFDIRHPTVKELPVHRTGMIITKVQAGSTAFKSGLQAGMELIALDGEELRRLPFLAIQQRLRDLDDDEVEAIFLTPVKPNVTISIRGSQLKSKKPPFAHQGMSIEHKNHHDHDHAHNASQDQEWLGLREHDEIVMVGQNPCYHALGSTETASRLLESTWKHIRRKPDIDFTLGVRRPSGGEAPPGFEKFFALPSVFRYATGTNRSHLATPPLMMRPGNDTGSFLCTAWLSHCGLVISFQPLEMHEFCIGIYAEDIQKLGKIEECPLDPWDPGLVNASTTTGDMSQATLTFSQSPRVKIYRLTLILGRSDLSDGSGSHVHIESTSEFTLRSIMLTIASIIRGIAGAKKEGARDANTLSNHIRASHQDEPEDSNEDGHQRGNSCASNIGMSDSNLTPYWALYKRYLKLYCPERDDTTRGPDLPPGQIAGKLVYQTWSNAQIAKRALMRENIAPKLFKHLAPVTRAERYAILCTAINTGFFWTTFLFNAKCGMKPKPASCIKKKKTYWYSRFEPTWDTVAGALFGLMLSTPVPLILLTAFRKVPVMEQMSAKEKKHRIRTWQAWRTFGWCFVVLCNLFYCYWFAVFSNEFPMEILGKFFNSAIQALVHRFISAPYIRGAGMLIVLVLSKYGPCCDVLLAIWPKIFIPAPLASYDAGDVDFAFDDEQDREDLDMDYGIGDLIMA
jgi:hypothetical protein